MTIVDERLTDSVSTGELNRRWSAVRERMRTADIDALIVQGANNLAGGGGYFRWFTGIAALGSYPETAIFPRDGLMTLVGHGPHGSEVVFDGSDTRFPGVGRRLSTASFPMVHYTGQYDVDLVAREIHTAGYRNVCYVGANSMHYGFGSKLGELVAPLRIGDATDLIDPIKAVKSTEEIAAIRQAAAMQDEIFAKTIEHVRPGLRDFELMAYSDHLGQLMGSQTGYFLGSSASPGKPAQMLMRAHQGREIGKGDVVLWQAENSGPGGYYVHLARYFVLGKPPQELVEAFANVVAAQDFTLELLKPGASCPDIFSAYNDYMRDHGMPEERRLHCHGQGFEAVERPLIRYDEPMPIAANMNIGIHPVMVNAEMFATVCDNFLIGTDGRNERLHATPRTIIEVPV